MPAKTVPRPVARAIHSQTTTGLHLFRHLHRLLKLHRQ